MYKCGNMIVLEPPNTLPDGQLKPVVAVLYPFHDSEMGKDKCKVKLIQEVRKPLNI